MVFKEKFSTSLKTESIPLIASHSNSLARRQLPNKGALVTWFIVYWSAIINMEFSAFSCETWRLDAEFWARQIIFLRPQFAVDSPLYTKQTAVPQQNRASYLQLKQLISGFPDKWICKQTIFFVLWAGFKLNRLWQAPLQTLLFLKKQPLLLLLQQ